MIYRDQLSGMQLEAFVNSDAGLVESGLILYPRYYLAEEKAPQSWHLPEIPAGQNRITSWYWRLTVPSMSG